MFFLMISSSEEEVEKEEVRKAKNVSNSLFKLGESLDSIAKNIEEDKDPSVSSDQGEASNEDSYVKGISMKTVTPIFNKKRFSKISHIDTRFSLSKKLMMEHSMTGISKESKIESATLKMSANLSSRVPVSKQS
jgi:hypothetical protein